MPLRASVLALFLVAGFAPKLDAADAPFSVCSAAAALEGAAVVIVESILPLTGFPAGASPLGFYQQLAVGRDGSMYLSAASGGRYPSVPHRVYAFDPSGAFRAGRGPKAATDGVAFVLGWRDESLLTVARELGETLASARPPWTLYELNGRDLTVISARAGVTPGVLVREEIVAAGLGITELGRTPGMCLHVFGLDGAFRRSFARCPETRGDALNGVESGTDGRNVYWVHANEGLVHVASLSGDTESTFGAPPTRFTTLGMALESAAARSDGSEAARPSRVDVIDKVTRVTRVLPVRDRLYVTYFLPPRIESEFWSFGSTVQVYDLSSRKLLGEFDTPLLLLGADDQERMYWISSRAGDPSSAVHAIVRTRSD